MTNAFESKFLIGSALILLAAVVVSYALLARNNAPAPQGAQATSTPRSAVLNAQRAGVAPLSQAQLSGMRQQGSPNSFIGTVESVSGAGIGVKVSSQGQESPSAMHVAINKDTEIYTRGKQKSDSEYQKEMLAFLAGIEADTDTSVNYLAPDQFEHTPLSLSDIRAGDGVLVTPAAEPAGGTVTALKIEKLSQAQPAAAGN
jgi:hypothetical protein